jgi:hypothetical protein
VNSSAVPTPAAVMSLVTAATLSWTTVNSQLTADYLC